jgi:F-type H+-transporting ATPase subunit b
LFEFGTFVFSIVMFVIMFWIVSRFGFKPIANMLRQRRQHVEAQINEAEESRAQAERLQNEQQQMLEEARQEAKYLVESARSRADEQGRELIAQAQEEAARLLDENRKQIEQERQEALNSVLDKVSGLTVELTTKLLRDHVTEAVHKDMLAEAEKRLGELVC